MFEDLKKHPGGDDTVCSEVMNDVTSCHRLVYYQPIRSEYFTTRWVLISTFVHYKIFITC